jgi:hypothetical protein
MAVPITLPSETATPAESIVGQTIYFGFEESGGSQENILVNVAGLTPNVEKLERKKVNTTSGLIETDRTVVTGISWTMRLTTDEASTELLNYYNNPYRAGVGRLWVGDPDDAVNTVSILTNEFSCTCSPDGETSFQNDSFSEFAIMVTINGTFTLTFNGATV